MPFNIGPGEVIILLLLAAQLAIPVLVVYLIVHWARTRNQSLPPPAPDPRAILATRLARGEISREAFDTAMWALGFEAPPAGRDAP